MFVSNPQPFLEHYPPSTEYSSYTIQPKVEKICKFCTQKKCMHSGDLLLEITIMSIKYFDLDGKV